ncbi:MAG: GcrA family cell cycle regulator [Alphaproteobacteria bacterium]|nr:GcrA family cell cycle regulator [Alphaproteobacteria bacterium]
MGWTEQQIETLKKMWGNGYSANDIAKNLGGGVTRNAVIGKAHRLKLSACAAASRACVDHPSKTVGVVVTKINKVSSKRRSMLRAMPPVQAVDKPASVATTIVRRPVLRPIETARRSEGIPVTKAGEHHCRWPIGDPRSPDFRFCGCQTQEGLPYCTHHARIAYQTISRRSRANANIESTVPEMRPQTDRE